MNPANEDTEEQRLLRQRDDLFVSMNAAFRRARAGTDDPPAGEQEYDLLKAAGEIVTEHLRAIKRRN